MILNIIYAFILQICLIYLNSRINYDYEYKKTSIISSVVLAIIVSYFNVSIFQSILTLTLFVCLLNISLIDLKYLEIPDTYNVAVLILGIINVIHLHHYSILITGLVSFVLFLIISIISGGALGGGDIKLSLGLGMFFTLSKYTSFLMYTFGVGAILALIMIITKNKDKEDKVPFAPFMAVGAILALII